jgi:hypothetical protein
MFCSNQQALTVLCSLVVGSWDAAASAVTVLHAAPGGGGGKYTWGALLQQEEGVSTLDR